MAIERDLGQSGRTASVDPTDACSVKERVRVGGGLEPRVGRLLPRLLDGTYREDESRIREEALRENFAWLNRFTLSLLKQHPDRTSIAMKRRSCGWNENYLLQVITGSTI
jgi:hypothetical protein